MKIHRLFVILFLVIGGNIYAQSKLSIGINSSYLVNDRIITKYESNKYKNYRNSHERYLSGFDIEAVIYYKLFGNFHLETGVGYLQNAYRVNEKDIIDPGYSPITAPFYSELTCFTFKNIYVPLHFSYITSKKLILNVSFGPTVLIPVKKDIEWILRLKFGDPQGQTVITNENPSKIHDVNLILYLGLGIGYRFSNKLGVIIQPKVQYYLLGDENTYLRDHFYNIGLFRYENKTTHENFINYGLTLKTIYKL